MTDYVKAGIAHHAEFDRLQAKWRALTEKAREFRHALEYKYGAPYYIHAPRGMREKADNMSKRADKASDSIFAWLDANSPRQWRTGCPAYWICDQLTYADAITTDRLSVTPPCCYGSYPSDMVRFAAPVQIESSYVIEADDPAQQHVTSFAYADGVSGD